MLKPAPMYRYDVSIFSDEGMFSYRFSERSLKAIDKSCERSFLIFFGSTNSQITAS